MGQSVDSSKSRVRNWGLAVIMRTVYTYMISLSLNVMFTLRKKSCHWGCTFSKDTLLYLKGAYWYLTGTY